VNALRLRCRESNTREGRVASDNGALPIQRKRSPDGGRDRLGSTNSAPGSAAATKEPSAGKRRNSDVGPKTLIEAARTIPRSVGPRRRRRRRVRDGRHAWGGLLQAGRPPLRPPLSSSDAVVRFVPSASARHWSPAQRPPPGLTTSPSWSSPTRAGTRSASATVTLRRRHPAPDPSECSS